MPACTALCLPSNMELEEVVEKLILVCTEMRVVGSLRKGDYPKTATPAFLWVNSVPFDAINVNEFEY